MIQLNMNTYASTKNKSAICMDCRLEHRDVEGATYIKIIILIINVTIIITIIVYTRVAHEYQYTPNLRPLVLAPLTPRKLNIQCRLTRPPQLVPPTRPEGGRGPVVFPPDGVGAHHGLVVIGH